MCSSYLYDEDLFPALRPAPGAEESVEGTLTVSALSAELVADPAALAEKYRNKILTVSGKLLSREPLNAALLLESGDTDQPLRVRCHFARHHFEDAGEHPAYTVRGRCSGLLERHTLRLDNCEALDADGQRDPRRLTADFLPHTPGQSLTYDVAVFSPLSTKATAVRQVFAQGEGGITDTVTTHVGVLPGTSLFDPGEQQKWGARKGTRRVHGVPGPSYARRVAGGFVEYAERVPRRRGDVELAWEPVLKLRARAGDSWTWTHNNAEHRYTLVKFDQHRGRPAAVIHETIRPPGALYPVEVRSVYAEGLGEVERRVTTRLTQREQKTLREKRLVEEAAPAPPKPPPGKK